MPIENAPHDTIRKVGLISLEPLVLAATIPNTASVSNETIETVHPMILIGEVIAVSSGIA
jgi:hypothetical protein